MLVSNAIRYGSSFQKPAKKVLRKAKAENGKRLFEPSEICQMLDASNPTLKAMILLGVNCAFGNSDCASLPLDVIDLQNGWIDYPRPKTGVERRCPLWSETVEAMKVAIESRPTPKGDENANLVFLTPGGSRWVYDNHNPLAKEVRLFLIELGIKRKGLSFYTLRHTFRTIADETRDFPAIDLVMGHSDNTMGGNYRERIADDRLKAVVDHVHDWLFSKPEADGDDEGVDANEADVQDDRPQLRIVG
jgi:integrase